MLIALVNGAVMTPAGVVDGQALLVEDGLIVGLVAPEAVPAGADIQDLAGGLLVPGFIDTQVNGGGGVLFNDAPTVET
ncbi:N-acetylglucosamine-6-phosphate deacetylase, partial [Caulobacter hibisci]|nr:N-acetylglucosamine-6-phosphate deacetylase [Caulobacter hibisci]